MAAVLAAVLAASCATSQSRAELPAEPVSIEQGGATVTMEPPREINEAVGSASIGCTIDAMKICRAYGESAPAEATSRTISFQIPDGPSIAVQCHYAAPGGALVSAVPPVNVRLDPAAEGFLSAQGFCAAPPGK